MKLALFTLTTAVALGTTAAQAGLVTWGTPTTISGDSDVSTTGTFIGALNWGAGVETVLGNPTTTVNGVTFTGDINAFPAGSSGPFSWTGGGGTAAFIASGHPGLSTSYQDLFRGWASPLNAGPRTLTLNGLTVGRTYQFQWWSDVNGNVITNTVQAIATAGNSVTLDSNTTDATGGLGQYVIGTFVADAATQNIAFTKSNPNASYSGAVNAFQLRDLGVVPEPSTALFGLALTGATLVRRRR
jgi:hypothetical protein